MNLQLERASRLVVEFDGVTWALCHERTPFIEMALTGISLTNLRNRDQSGEGHCQPSSPASYRPPLQRHILGAGSHPGARAPSPGQPGLSDTVALDVQQSVKCFS